jgi:hypothetical protein
LSKNKTSVPAHLIEIFHHGNAKVGHIALVRLHPGPTSKVSHNGNAMSMSCRMSEYYLLGSGFVVAWWFLEEA